MRKHILAHVLVAGLGVLLAGAAQAHDPSPPPWFPRPRPRPIEVPHEAGFRAELLDESGFPLSTFSHHGRRYVLGELGRRYTIRIVNPTASRVEAVVSVDGLDAIDGKTASLGKRGYVIPPYGDVSIEGFRTSLDAVAAFRFSSVPDSYAGRKGQDRNVGVIGVAFFRERALPPPRPRPLEVPRSSRAPGEGAGKSRSQDAPAPSASPRAPEGRADESHGDDRPGLGTEFGEHRDSRVGLTTFQRASSSPSAVVEMRYNDREGLRALGIRIPPTPIPPWDDLEQRESAEPFPGMHFAAPPP